MPDDIPNTPVVPYLEPQQHDIVTQHRQSLVTSGWYDDATVTDVPLDSVGWMVSQGWTIISVRLDATTKPPTPYYTMERRTINNENILNTLIVEYTVAQNQAVAANEKRYNEVVAEWDTLMLTTQTQFGEQVSAQNTHAGFFLGDLGTAMDAVETLIERNEAGDSEGGGLVKDIKVATDALTALDAKLTALEENYDASAVILVGADGTAGLLGDQQDYLTAFLAAFVLKLAELSTNYTNHLTEIIGPLLETASEDLDAFKAEQSTRLGEFETAYTDHARVLDDLLAEADSFMDTVVTDVGDVLTDIDNDYTDLAMEVNTLLTDDITALATHTNDYNSVLATLEADYADHAPVATEFLNNLGATELARINEKFTASLSTQLQQLIDKGTYSSAVAGDITARNTRDHNEEIVALNDGLNRRQLDNQHKLYEQQTAMRTGTMAGKARVHGIQQELLRYRTSQAFGLHGLEQSVRERTLNGKQAIYGIKLANNRLHSEVKSALYEAGQTVRKVLTEEAARLQQLQQSITQWTTGQRDQLYTQIQSVAAKNLEGLSQQHVAQQTVSGAAIVERNTLLQQLQDAVKGFLSGKERYAALTAQNASTLAEQRHRIIAERMTEIMTRATAGQKKHDEDMQLMAYQLDERNKLLIGLYGFVERREDVGPSIEDLSKLATGLGDAGGGWITP